MAGHVPDDIVAILRRMGTAELAAPLPSNSAAAQRLHDEVAYVVAQAVGLPHSLSQQPLHRLRSQVSGLFGQPPAVLALDARQQASQERSDGAARLHQHEPTGDSRHRLVQQLLTPARVYAMAHGHRGI
jgi:hypothetical protein